MTNSIYLKPFDRVLARYRSGIGGRHAAAHQFALRPQVCHRFLQPGLRSRFPV
jgi:hypothetical protein